MSPYLRNLLEDAADDGGRPVALDLAAVRTAGRRATWRQRALIAGGGVAAVAVITSVAVLLAPGGAATFGPAMTPSPVDVKPTPPDGGVPGDPGAEALEDALAPLIDALRDRGSDVAVEGGIGAGGAPETDGLNVQADATVLTVKQGGTVGAAVVAEFTDRTPLYVGNAVPGSAGPCAVPPVLAEAFAWDFCYTDASYDPDGDRYLLAKEGHEVDEALGVTLVRPDGSGIPVVLGTSAHDPTRVDTPAPPLDSLPLTHLELVEVVDQLDARAPLAPPMLPPPTAEPESPPSDFPCLGDAPPPECLPIDGVAVEIGPLIDTLLDRGLRWSP